MSGALPCQTKSPKARKHFRPNKTCAEPTGLTENPTYPSSAAAASTTGLEDIGPQAADFEVDGEARRRWASGSLMRTPAQRVVQRREDLVDGDTAIVVGITRAAAGHRQLVHGNVYQDNDLIDGHRPVLIAIAVARQRRGRRRGRASRCQRRRTCGSGGRHRGVGPGAGGCRRAGARGRRCRG